MQAIVLEECAEWISDEPRMDAKSSRLIRDDASNEHADVVVIRDLNGDVSSVRASRGKDSKVSSDLPTRHSLLSRLRDLGDNESWRTFFDTYWRLIYNVARKSGLTDDQAQEVVQETVIAVARKIPSFRYDPSKGSFKHWLLLICRRRIHDHLRRVYSSRDVTQEHSPERDLIEGIPAAQSLPDEQMDRAWDEAWRENIFSTALARVKQRANPKSFQVFECLMIRNMPSSQVAMMLGLSAAQVYLAKHRISAALKRAAKQIEAELSVRQQQN